MKTESFTNTYKLTFDNGVQLVSQSLYLSGTHVKIVKYMNQHQLNWCEIICPNGQKRYVRKTGTYHPIHEGFQFSK